MVRQDLVEFVVSWLKEGQEIEDIRSALSNGGYSQNEINEVVITASEKYTSQLKAVKFGKVSKVEKPAKHAAKEEKKEEREEKEQLEETPLSAFSGSSAFKNIEETVSKATEEMRLLHAQGARHVPPKERRHATAQDAMLPEISVTPPSNLPYILGFAIVFLAVAGAAYFVYTFLSTASAPTGEFALVPADSNFVMYMNLEKFYSDADIKDAMKAYYAWMGELSTSLSSLSAYSGDLSAIYNESLVDEQWKDAENASSAVMFMNMDRLVASVNSSIKSPSSSYYPYTTPKNLSLRGIGAIIKVKGDWAEQSTAEFEEELAKYNLTFSSREYGGVKIYSLDEWPDYNALTNYSAQTKPSNPFASYNSTYNPFDAYDVKSFALAILDAETLVLGTVDEVEAVIDVKNGRKQSVASRADFQEVSKDIDATGLFSMVIVMDEEELKAIMEKYPSSSTQTAELKSLKGGFSIDKNNDPISMKAVFYAPNATVAEKAVDAANGAVKLYRGMTTEGSTTEAMLNGVKLSNEGVKLKFSFDTSVTQIKALVEEFKQQQRQTLLKRVEECNNGDSPYFYSKSACYGSLIVSITDKSDCSLITDEEWSVKCVAKLSVKSLEGLSACDEFASTGQKDACISYAVTSLTGGDWLKAKNYSFDSLYFACGSVSTTSFADDCFDGIASYSQNPFACERVSNLTTKDDCFNTIAYNTRNSTICQSISIDTVRKKCEKNALVRWYE